MEIHRKVGTSGINALPELIKWILKLTPKKDARVTDVGCGKGMIGYMLRSMFPNKVYLTGIEYKINDRFRGLLSLVYDQLYEKDMTRVRFDVLKSQDVILMNHVLEHIRLEQAVDLIKTIQGGEHKALLVGLPNSRKGHIYNQDSGPHSHKWGIYDFPYNELGMIQLETKKNNLFLWTRLKDKE